MRQPAVCVTRTECKHATRGMLRVRASKTGVLVLAALFLAVVGRIVDDAESMGLDPEVKYDAVCGDTV